MGEPIQGGDNAADMPMGLDDEAAAAIFTVLESQASSDTSTPESVSDEVVSTIGGYVVDGCIGRGATGTVYRVLKPPMDRPYALKHFHHHLGDSPQARRAWREIDVLQQTDVPYVPKLHDYGLHDGRLFLVTDFVRGAPVDESYSDRTIDLSPKVVLLARLADVVHSLHERGIVHRDVKPSNVLVDDDGQPHVIDLGIAALIADDPMQTLTTEGAPIGSPAFMSPEQARGARSAISTRSDIYGLGATVCKLLTGSTPHDMAVTIHEAIRRVAHDPPRAPRALNPALPKTLASIIGKACAQKPSDRYASAAELAADLRRFLNREPVMAAPPGLYQRATRWIARHPVLGTAAACGTIALLTLVATWAALWWSLMAPADVDFDPLKPNRATLVSAGGKILHTWTNPDKNSTIILAEMIERSDGADPSRIVVIGYAGSSQQNGVSGSLCVYDPRDPEQPIMQFGEELEPSCIPPMYYPLRQGSFRLGTARIADVFEDDRGEPEIIATHTYSPRSQTVIRIYNLDGQVLFESWHDGEVLSVYWMPTPRLLVHAAHRSDDPWEARGVKGMLRRRYPVVCFAVQPEQGWAGDAWIGPEMIGQGDSPVAWYRCLWPPEAVNALPADGLEFAVAATTRPHDPHTTFRFIIHDPDLGNGLAFVLDAEGELDPKATVVHDWYEGDSTLPPASDFRFVGLPPVQPSD